MQEERIWDFQEKSGWLPRSLKMNLFLHHIFIPLSKHPSSSYSRHWTAATDSLGLKKVAPIVSELGLEICSWVALGSYWTLSISSKMVCVWYEYILKITIKLELQWKIFQYLGCSHLQTTTHPFLVSWSEGYLMSMELKSFEIGSWEEHFMHLGEHDYPLQQRSPLKWPHCPSPPVWVVLPGQS